MKLSFILSLTILTILGAGCSTSKQPIPNNTAANADLRQPAPPAAPKEQPVIPKEAEKIPRPY